MKYALLGHSGPGRAKAVRPLDRDSKSRLKILNAEGEASTPYGSSIVVRFEVL